MYTLRQISEVTKCEFFGRHDNLVTGFLHDSRQLHDNAGTLFIALSSKRNNAHRFIPELIKKGMRSFLVKKSEIDPALYPEASFLISENPLQTIQKLAAHHRSRFNIPVIGITGSNGKTMVKEWLYQCLKNDFSICRSPRSYNSQIGVPLSLLNLTEEHTLGIFEAGISQKGEMQLLAEMIQPTLGVFTSLGSAHDEGFHNRSEKISEKFKLFASAGQIIVNGLKSAEIPSAYSKKSTLVDQEINLPSGFLFKDEASVANGRTCLTVLSYFNVTPAGIAERLANLQTVALRMEIRNGIHNTLLINDYYNSDLDSLRIALNYLQNQSRRPRKIVIISDIEQSGIAAATLYRKVSEELRNKGIDQVIGIGPEISKHRSLFPSNSQFFEEASAFVSQFRTFGFSIHNASVLLKGARSFGFEAISRILQQKSHDTVMEIDLNLLTANVNYYRSLLDENVRLMCMVKAMGYGSGSAEIARTLQNIGVSYLAVAYADEGVELRESLISLPVMVMSPEEEAFDDIINFQLEPEIYSFRILEKFCEKLDAFGITEPFPVHIKIDTGMHRLGFVEEEIALLCEKLRSISGIRVVSVFSHLAASDNPDLDKYTQQQIHAFEAACSAIESALAYPVIKHICNSAGITRFKKAHYNMVRLGIGMYGIGADKEDQKHLQNVGTLKSRISQIKHLRAGDTVGYNRNGKLGADTSVAVIPIGYADGFSRLLGNGRHGVYINGAFCPTLGNICMDMCMVDVSNVKCKEGDEVIIFSGPEQIFKMAAALQSIPYEVLTSVSSRVRRIYIQE